MGPETGLPLGAQRRGAGGAWGGWAQAQGGEAGGRRGPRRGGWCARSWPPGETAVCENCVLSTGLQVLPYLCCLLGKRSRERAPCLPEGRGGGTWGDLTKAEQPIKHQCFWSPGVLGDFQSSVQFPEDSQLLPRRAALQPEVAEFGFTAMLLDGGPGCYPTGSVQPREHCLHGTRTAARTREGRGNRASSGALAVPPPLPLPAPQPPGAKRQLSPRNRHQTLPPPPPPIPA